MFSGAASSTAYVNPGPLTFNIRDSTTVTVSRGIDARRLFSEAGYEPDGNQSLDLDCYPLARRTYRRQVLFIEVGTFRQSEDEVRAFLAVRGFCPATIIEVLLVAKEWDNNRLPYTWVLDQTLAEEQLGTTAGFCKCSGRHIGRLSRHDGPYSSILAAVRE
ncbi:MAG: hypothetical protein HYY50_02615 [Candidatus Kerfeldbacteria bacterium]|nr:hypothetical protein [Candidatus Kerfeldbacteria bacterium]